MKLLAFFLCVVSLFTCSGLHAQTTKNSEESASPSCGPVTGQVLRCPRFGFTYKMIFGWVDRTDEMQQDVSSELASGTSKDDGQSEQQQQRQPSSAGSRTLLAIFERPPGAPGDTVDSAVVIVAEPLANYRGVKTAAEYFSAISELAEQRGFTPTADPHPVSIGARQLVRGDFTQERGKLTTYQASLAMIAKGYIVSFTFIGGSEDEVNDLIANLSFSAERLPSRMPKEKK